MMSDARIKMLKEEYPRGTRVELDRMGDDEPRQIEPGTKGTVIAVDDMGTVHCNFDNGRSFGICPEVDSFHKIKEQTEDQSFGMSM